MIQLTRPYFLDTSLTFIQTASSEIGVDCRVLERLRPLSEVSLSAERPPGWNIKLNQYLLFNRKEAKIQDGVDTLATAA